MSLKICGHQVRWHKPIKFYSLVKLTLMFAVANFVASASVSAADPACAPLTVSSSSGDPAPCQPLLKSADKQVLHKTRSARTQRSAGPSSLSPAMMLALALGYRNISGPVLHTAANKPAPKTSAAPERQAMLVEGDRGRLRSNNAILPGAGGTFR